MTDFNNTIAVLNKLIETSKDGEEGFRTSAEIVEDPRLHDFFMRRFREVGDSVRELQELVISVGGVPASSPSIGGAIHRRWLEIRAALAKNDIIAVLKEIERGEFVAISNYYDALEKDLPSTAKFVVTRQLDGAKHNFELVRSFRESYEDEAATHE
jgi:uncharacterized protein (TIGR02284 family)